MVATPTTGIRRPSFTLDKCRARSTTMPLPVPPAREKNTSTIDGSRVSLMLFTNASSSFSRLFGSA
jgi:hypothetical protein